MTISKAILRAVTGLALVLGAAPALGEEPGALPGLPLAYEGMEASLGGTEQAVAYTFTEVIENDGGRVVVEGQTEAGLLGFGSSPATLIVDAESGTATIYPAAHDNLAGCNGRYIGEISADWRELDAQWIDFAGNEGPRLDLALSDAAG